MKRRIAFYGIKTFPSQGGTDRVAENIIFHCRDKFEITLYCFQDLEHPKPFDGIRVIQFKRRAAGAIGVFIYFFESFLHLFFSGNVELVHVHKTESTFFVPFLRLRYKVISTSHEAQYRSDKWGFFEKIFFHVVERVFIRASNVCTTISEPLSKYYESKYKKKIHFVPNGINPIDRKDFDYANLSAFIPPGASLEKPFILFSARRLMRIKGCHTMLSALKRINYGGQIFITGELHTEAEYLEELKRLADGLNVFFLGFVKPLNVLLALLDKAELFIFPSVTEGMSIMLLEVASVGRPIIASDIPENKQVFSGDEVMYFKTTDDQDLAEKISFGLKNKERMLALGRLCQDRVYRDYLWSSIAVVYERLYNSMLLPAK